MLIYRDRFAAVKLPAAYTTAGALCTISAAYFPVVGGLRSLQYDFAFWQPVRVIAFPATPVRKDYF